MSESNKYERLVRKMKWEEHGDTSSRYMGKLNHWTASISKFRVFRTEEPKYHLRVWLDEELIYEDSGEDSIKPAFDAVKANVDAKREAKVQEAKDKFRQTFLGPEDSP